MPERKEYRVVGFKDGSGAEHVTKSFDYAVRIAEQGRRVGHSEVRIQTRTVRETLWVDLPESKQGGGES